MHKTKHGVGSDVTESRRKREWASEASASSNFLASVEKSRDLRANSALRCDKNKTTKEGISPILAKHSMGDVRLYGCSRITQRHWVRQSKHQNPRGGSRGAVTRIFPAVSPGRGGVVRGNLLVPSPACQLHPAPGVVPSADSFQ